MIKQAKGKDKQKAKRGKHLETVSGDSCESMTRCNKDLGRSGAKGEK